MTTKPETLISVAATLVRGVPWRVPSERTRVPVWVRAQLVEIDEWARDLGCRVRDGYDALRKRAEKAEARVAELEGLRAGLMKDAIDSPAIRSLRDRAEKAESDRAVLVACVRHYHEWLSDVAEGDPARAAMAKAGE